MGRYSGVSLNFQAKIPTATSPTKILLILTKNRKVRLPIPMLATAWAIYRKVQIENWDPPPRSYIHISPDRHFLNPQPIRKMVSDQGYTPVPWHAASIDSPFALLYLTRVQASRSLLRFSWLQHVGTDFHLSHRIPHPFQTIHPFFLKSRSFENFL